MHGCAGMCLWPPVLRLKLLSPLSLSHRALVLVSTRFMYLPVCGSVFVFACDRPRGVVVVLSGSVCGDVAVVSVYFI